jgi:hypothetical protein
MTESTSLPGSANRPASSRLPRNQLDVRMTFHRKNKWQLVVINNPVMDIRFRDSDRFIMCPEIRYHENSNTVFILRGSVNGSFQSRFKCRFELRRAASSIRPVTLLSGSSTLFVRIIRSRFLILASYNKIEDGSQGVYMRADCAQ